MKDKKDSPNCKRTVWLAYIIAALVTILALACFTGRASVLVDHIVHGITDTIY